MYKYVLLAHLLGASVWTGGHLYLLLRVLPEARRKRSAAHLLAFEQSYERLGFGALAIQVVTGLWLASHVAPVHLWLRLDSVASQMIVIKLALLALTALTAIDARFRVLPRMTDERVRTMTPHVTIVTTAGVLFVAAGIGFRTGGWF